MSLPPINIVLKATTDGFRRGVAVVDGQLDKLDRSADSVSRRMQAMGDKMAYVGNRMSLITGAAVAVGGALFAIAANAAKAGDAIGDSAKAAGMSTTAFQEYRFALKDAADMTDDEFASAVVKLNKTLGEAREGSTSAVAAFEAIGVSQEQLLDPMFNTDQAMAAFVAKMEAVTDPATAAAIAADLFGKSGARIGAGLSGVPGQVQALIDRARELGLATPAMIEASGKFDSSMKELGQAVEATKMKIAEVLLPVIVNQLIPALIDDVLPAIRETIDTVGGWITAFGELDPAVQNVVGVITTAFAVGGPMLLAIAGVVKTVTIVASAFSPWVIAIGLVVAAGTWLWKNWEPISTAISESWTVIKTAVTDTGQAIMDSIGAAIDWVSTKFNEFLALLDSIIQKAKDVGTAVAEALGVSFGGDGTARGPGSGGATRADVAQGGGRVPRGRGRGGARSPGYEVGAALSDGIADGTRDGLAARTPELAGIFAQLPQIAREVLGINSPSRVFAEMGTYVGQGFANGIKSTTGIVQTAVSTMSAGAVASGNAMVSDILSGLDTLFAGSQKAGAAIALVNTFIGASQEIKKGTFGFASAAKVIAQGMSFVKAIKGAKNGSGGAGGGGGGGGTTGTMTAAQAPLDVRLNTVGGGDMVRWSEVGSLLDELSVRAGDRGYRIMVPK